METAIIEVNNLTKFYNGFKAVDNISFQVRKGDIFGFLGPNGAGKTTTIKAMLGLIHTIHGHVKIDGFKIKITGKEFKKRIGYLPEHVAFYPNLTALENLNFYAELKNLTPGECISLIAKFGLAEHAHKKVGKFSAGMIQRLGLARACLGNPMIIVLDEPFAGVDPRGVITIRDTIKKYNKQGVTFFISSHVLSEIQMVCNHVAIINKGALVVKDNIQGLSNQLKIKPWLHLKLSSISDKILKAVKKIKGVYKINITGNNLNIMCDPVTKIKVVLAIEKSGGNILNIQTKEPSLEEIFLRYTERRKKQ
jgi:ABC-type multidrug transport system ATPase subunit